MTARPKPAVATILAEWAEWHAYISVAGFARKHGYSVSGIRHLLARHGVEIPHRYNLSDAERAKRAAWCRENSIGRRRRAA